MNHFVLALKNEKLLYYHRMAVLLLMLNFAAFVIIAIYTGVTATRNYAIIGVITTTLGLALAYWQYHSFVKTGVDKRNVIGLYFAVICWVLMQNWVPAVICLVVQVFYSISIKKQLVNVATDEVQYPGLFVPATAKWNELNNIVLKDGLLTIDFKNNKIIQAEIVEQEPGVNEQAFNQFCTARLQHHSAAV